MENNKEKEWNLTMLTECNSGKMITNKSKIRK